MFELKPYHNRGKRGSNSVLRLPKGFLCVTAQSCVSLQCLVMWFWSRSGWFSPSQRWCLLSCTPWVALRAHSWIYSGFFGHRHCVKADPCPVGVLQPPLTQSCFCQQLGPALSKHLHSSSCFCAGEVCGGRCHFGEGSSLIFHCMCLCHVFVIHRWLSMWLCRCHVWCAMSNLPENLW